MLPPFQFFMNQAQRQSRPPSPREVLENRRLSQTRAASLEQRRRRHVLRGGV